jgi:hypothetical protein
MALTRLLDRGMNSPSVTEQVHGQGEKNTNASKTQ